jgi:hypothetical protein
VDDEIVNRTVSCVDERKTTGLARNQVRIPSPRYEEAKLAEYIAGYMEGTGMDIDLQEVKIGSIRSKQAIWKFSVSGGGQSLMFCGI